MLKLQLPSNTIPANGPKIDKDSGLSSSICIQWTARSPRTADRMVPGPSTKETEMKKSLWHDAAEPTKQLHIWVRLYKLLDEDLLIIVCA